MPLPWHGPDSSTLPPYPSPLHWNTHFHVLMSVYLCVCSVCVHLNTRNLSKFLYHLLSIPWIINFKKLQKNNDQQFSPHSCIEAPALMPNPILTPCFPCPALQNKLFALACSAEGFSVLDFVLQGLVVSGTLKETKYLSHRMKANV